MTDLYDIIYAVPKVSTLLSAYSGFIVEGSISFAGENIKKGTLAAIIMGTTITIVNNGNLENYVVNIGSAIVGGYLGYEIAKKIIS